MYLLSTPHQKLADQNKKILRYPIQPNEIGINMNTQKIILASSSKTRIKQLTNLGINFTAIAPNIDETPKTKETANDLVTRLSISKAEAINNQQHQDSLIIAGDQILSVGTKILGKPKTQEQAIQQLLSCSNKHVIFYTGLCLLNTKTQKHHYQTTTTEAKFRTLTQPMIEKYLALDQPLNCAGSIQIESKGMLLIERLITDDPYAILGIPTIALSNLFAKENICLLTLAN